MNSKILVCVLLSFVTFLRSQDSESMLNKTVVFSTEKVNDIEYGYRIPALLTTKKGTVLAFAERRHGLHDHARNDIVLKRSFDNGVSWEAIQIIADFGKNSLTNSAFLSSLKLS